MSKLDLTKIKYERFATANYKGMEFTYKKWLTLAEQRGFIDAVLSGCEMDNEYSEVLREYATRVAFLTFYTDIDLFNVDNPDDYLYGGLHKDIFLLIAKDIDGAEYESMMREIEDKINSYNSEMAVAIREVSKTLESFNVPEMLAKMMGDIQNPEVIKWLKDEING